MESTYNKQSFYHDKHIEDTSLLQSEDTPELAGNAQNYAQQLTGIKAREGQLNKTLGKLENDLKLLAEENKELRQCNSVLEAKLEITKGEKEMHVKSHANAQKAWEREKQRLVIEVKALKSRYYSGYESTMQLISEIQQTVEGLKTGSTQHQELSLRKTLYEHGEKIKVSPM